MENIAIPHQKEIIIEQYNSGKAILEVSQLAGLSVGGLYYRLQKWGIERRTPKYDVNEGYFDQIDSEDKAYFLGFLYADGYNGEKQMKYRVVLSLNKRDEEILHKFRNYLGSNHCIYQNQRTCSTFAVHSKRLSKRLTELGCHRAKTFTITFPEWLDRELIPHFIRGYNDGDGYIHFNGKGVTVGSLGATAFIYRLAEEVKEHCGVHISFRPHPRSKGITSWQVRGRDQVSTVLAWLYKDATVYLERKKRKAEAVLTPVYYDTKPNGSDCHLTTTNEAQVLEIKEMLLQKFRPIQISQKLNISSDVVKNVAKGRTWHHLTNLSSRQNLAVGRPKGIHHGMAKLSESDVLTIKDLINAGQSNIEIGKHFLVSKDIISKIRCGKIWSHVTAITYVFQGKARKGENNNLSKLTDNLVKDIKARLLEGESGASIARSLGVSKSCISGIKQGKVWSHVA